MKTTIAIVQSSPSYYDLKESLNKATDFIQSAAQQGAQLITFGETWLTGYPAWIDYLPKVALWDYEPTKQAFQLMYDQAICVPSSETEQLGELARKHQIVIVIGVNEKGVNGTIYNSLLTFDPHGNLAIHHRKLMPTYTEKLLYGLGDGKGLATIQTNFGRVGSLICWEHWMPLTRQAMHNAGEHIHVAVWPTVHDKHQLASRHYAFEGRCFVVASGQILRVKDLPPILELPPELSSQPDHFLMRGGSAVIAPNGAYLMEPKFDIEDLFIVEIPDINQTIRERMTLDVTGHYQRKDVFHFDVNTVRTP